MIISCDFQGRWLSKLLGHLGPQKNQDCESFSNSAFRSHFVDHGYISIVVRCMEPSSFEKRPEGLSHVSLSTTFPANLKNLTFQSYLLHSKLSPQLSTPPLPFSPSPYSCIASYLRKDEFSFSVKISVEQQEMKIVIKTNYH